ncbi:hypothetical protein E4U43_007470 [Claviceps pusilla]|uniref:Tat pathway signal sequence n=1 Tax=Claviceps pusilla TaxID=123648 RepID=A0A9P7SY34_9HYPO|nr:hypothetical protein E4U43_007470 [Claviceps pusilla]
MEGCQTTEDRILVNSVAAGLRESADKLSPMAASIPTAPPPVKLHVVTDFRQKVYNPGAIPRIPLRIPRKHSQRSMSSPFQLPYRASCGSSSTITSTGYMSSPYWIREKERSQGYASPDSGELNEKQWFSQRKRSRRFLLTVGAITFVILVTLAIALPLGLRDKVSTQGRQTEDGDDDSIGALFPSGSFLFKTSLQKIEAGCTSRNTTWTCGPMQPGDASVFYWDIMQLNRYTYTITSTGNPFAPDFRNVSMKIRDYNKPTERLEFSLSMNKTVIPSDAGSPTNRAAKCTYVDTTFQATLYTRKRGSTIFDRPRRHANYSTWPGDVHIIQSLPSTVGQPMCRDASNNLIADVAAGIGTCQCQYGSD